MISTSAWLNATNMFTEHDLIKYVCLAVMVIMVTGLPSLFFHRFSIVATRIKEFQDL